LSGLRHYELSFVLAVNVARGHFAVAERNPASVFRGSRFEWRLGKLGLWFFLWCDAVQLAGRSRCVVSEFKCGIIRLGNFGCTGWKLYGFRIKLSLTSFIGPTCVFGCGKASLVVAKPTFELLDLRA
jgi:hypothetical protein